MASPPYHEMADGYELSMSAVSVEDTSNVKGSVRPTVGEDNMTAIGRYGRYVGAFAVVAATMGAGIGLGYWIGDMNSSEGNSNGSLALGIRVESVNGHAERNVPEPYKESVLCATSDCSTEDGDDSYCWELTLTQPDWYHQDSRENFHHEECRKSKKFSFTFTAPGTYEVTVRRNSDNTYGTTQVENLYARRDIRDLDDEELNLYVDAVWKMQNTSTAEGRKQFNCPTGNQDDYHTRDFFVLVHTALSYNSSCDQLHFHPFFPLTHLAWMDLMERSLQCIHPSVAQPYWDFPRDDGNAPLGSTIFDLYGGLGNVAESTDNAEYYVTDGLFANFPLRKNRTGLCEDFWDDELIEDCNSIIHDPSWRGPADTTGFHTHVPRPLDSYDYVSRRSGFIFGRDSTFLFPQSSDVQHILEQDSFYDATYEINNGVIHTGPHHFVSGMWMPSGGDEITSEAIDFATASMANMNIYSWPFEAGLRKDNCYTCDESSCFHAEDADARGCYDDQIETPTSFTAPVGSTFHDFQMRARTNTAFLEGRFGTNRPNTGTYGRHPAANMDPLFDLCHMYAVVVLDRWYRTRTDGPYYGVETALDPQCPGDNFHDATPFRSLAPYEKSQTFGARQTWADILRGWDFGSRNFRFVQDYDRFTSP